MEPAGAATGQDLLGGRLALDFVNTVEPRIPPGQRDYLPDYGALAAWSVHSGAVAADEAPAMRSAAAEDPRRAAAVWRRAVALREALYRVFLAVAEGRPPRPGDLVVLTQAFARAQRHALLTADAGQIRWRWDVPADVERPLWEVARSAVEILTSDDASRLGVCRQGTDGCGWTFIDATKNRSRRWCGMADCGSRAKARRLTERRRQARGDSQPAPSPQPAASSGLPAEAQ